MIRLWLAAALAAALAPAAAAEDVARYELRATSIEGCPGLALPRGARELYVSGERAVDAQARFWTFDRPTDYRGGRSERRYRVGDGALRADATLAGDRSEETVRLWIERPIDARYVRAYLPDLALPCERRTRYAVEPLPPAPADLDALARFDALLLEATELQYDARFAEARARLEAASALRPQDPTPLWMLARARYLELEAADLPAPDALAGYVEAEGWAEAAVERAPDRAEGWLWRGALRGRIATQSGDVRAALATLGGRGPLFVEHALQKAVSLPEDYRFFGDSTRADALHALAQYYRLAPDAWYMLALGTRGDLARAVELSAEAVRSQPVRIDYRTEHAAALLCRGGPGDVDAAHAELRAALDLPAITPVDARGHAHARQWLAGREAPCARSFATTAKDAR
jgi:hypothetical protein